MIILGLVYKSTITVSSKNGAINADSLPNVTIFRDAVQTSLTATIQAVSIGVYSYEFTIPNDWDIGNIIDVHFEVTVGGKSIILKNNLGPIQYNVQNIPVDVWRGVTLQ